MNDVRNGRFSWAKARIEELERENQLQAQEIDKTRARADKWQGMVIDCEKYLKPGETPRQRMDRDHADVLALMKLLEKEKYRAEAAEAKLEKAKRMLEWWQSTGCPVCSGDCASANPSPGTCIMKETSTTLAELGENDDG